MLTTQQIGDFMLRRSFAFLAAASALALSAPAYEDPVGDEIQRRMMEQQQQQINDMVAAQQAWGEEEEDYPYEEPPSYSEEEWHDWAAEGARAEAKRLQERANDPKYQAFLNGEWLHTPPAKAGQEGCSVMFLRRGVGTIVLATGGMKDPAIFAFFSMDVPRPASLVETSATLSETGEQPATVRVFNATLPWMTDYGIVFFAVPSAEAALGGMVDQQGFGVAMDGRDVAAIEWTGGLAARDDLSACIAARR
ncbi:MAG: hypothetical protein QM698_13790 [Micropepsaceae bacterium]